MFIFIFILFLFISIAGFIVYVNLTSQISTNRKRIMLLMNENKELRAKIKTLISASENSNPKIIEIDAIEENEPRDE